MNKSPNRSHYKQCILLWHLRSTLWGSFHHSKCECACFWRQFGWQTWWQKQGIFPGLGSRTGRIDGHAYEETIFRTNYENIDLHISSDAPLESVCIATYLRAEEDDGVELSIVIGKCRIAAKKQQTIPKLELQAAVYSVRWRQLITKNNEIKIQPVTHWTNSMTVLQWLHFANKKQQVFVTNRVGKILHQTFVDKWWLVKGTVNPTDIGARRVSVSQLLGTRGWIGRPGWSRIHAVGQRKQNQWMVTILSW